MSVHDHSTPIDSPHNQVEQGEQGEHGKEGEQGEQDDRWKAVRELPPSSKLVAKVLDDHDTLTQRELATETLLSARTVRGAVNRLEDAGVVESRVSFTDARKQLYWLTI